MRRLLPILAALALFAVPVFAQPSAPPAATAALPLNPSVRTGKLPNGLTYYVQRNAEPRQRAELRLAINAGSVFEGDNQRGVAHFLEHMLFNGTRRFDKQELVQFLESTGMRFGGDVNAYTSFDETVYTLTVPTDSARLLDRSFDVLEDWLSAASLDPSEIDRERGVIIEEWRQRGQNAQGRILEKLIPALFSGSRYATRLPIGDTATIRRAPYARFREFYSTWYRPDNAAIVVVGDVDVAATEARIRRGFADLRAPAAPLRRPTYAVPGSSAPRYLAVSDPEYPVTTVEVSFTRPSETEKTVGDLRERLVSRLFERMLNARLDEIERAENAPFLDAQVYRGGIVRPSEYYGMQAQTDAAGVEAGLTALLREAERVRKHGFTAGELERQKAEVLRAYERAYTERERTNSAAFADAYVGHFLSGAPATGAEYAFRTAQGLLPAITAAEVSAETQALLRPQNRLVVVTTTDRPDAAEITTAGLKRLDERIGRALAAETIAPYEDRAVASALIETPPAPAAVTATRRVEALDVTEITLANGVRVVMKPTAFKADEVRFTSTSAGGTSRVSDADAFAAGVAPSIVAESGAGAFTKDDLERQLAGKTVSVSPYVSELDEGFNGSAAPADLETALQLVHLYATAPRVEAGALAQFQNGQRALLANRSATPQGAFQDTLQAALYGQHPRRRTPTVADVDGLNAESLARLYRERFADAAGMTFTFVGNFSVDTLTTLAQRYLGTLPSAGAAETWRDVYPDLPTGVVQKAAYKGVAPQSQVVLIYHGPFRYVAAERQRIRALADVLSIRLREKVREELSGVYGIQAQANYTDRPDSTYQLFVFFACDPARVDELTNAVAEQVRAIQAEAPPAEQVATVKEQQRRERETSLRQNAFWVGALDTYFAWPDAGDAGEILTYPALVEALTPADVQASARRYLDPARFVRVVLYPESMKPAE